MLQRNMRCVIKHTLNYRKGLFCCFKPTYAMNARYTHKMLWFLTSLTLPALLLAMSWGEAPVAAIRPIETRAAPYVEKHPRSFYTAQDMRAFYPALGQRAFELPSPVSQSTASLGDLAEIKQHGKLRILSAYQHQVVRPGQETKPGYAMAREFAAEHGLEAELIEISDPARLLEELTAGNGDIIIGSAPQFDPDQVAISKTLALGVHTYQVIARHDGPAIKNPSDLYGKRVALKSSSPLWPVFAEYRSRYPEIQVIEVPDYWGINDFLNRIAEGEYDATVIESDQHASALILRPDITISFDLVKQQSSAWLVRNNNNELRSALDDFLNRKHLARRQLPLYQEDLHDLKQHNVLRVITRPDPHNYFIRNGKPAGFEYELVQKFAEENHLRVKIVQAGDEAEMLELLEQGRGDMITSMLLDIPDPERVIQSAAYNRADEFLAADALQVWSMMAASTDLQKAVDAFLSKEYRSEFYNVNYRKYFADRVEERNAKHIRTEKLSPYDKIAKAYAARYNFDWRLIVAQMYMESRFNPAVVSHMGAEGLMQVLPATANEMGFSDVTSPEQGIHAGVQYMDWLRQRFDEQDLTIQDRTWFSLASYNAGLARVQRARKLAAELGLDPNRWFGNVEIAIRKISGCHCSQTVAYVSDIRNLYDAYVQMINSIHVAELRLNRSSYSS